MPATAPCPCRGTNARGTSRDVSAAALRFLVVEDHPLQRWELARQLRDLGARQIFEAQDGQSALEIVQNLAQPLDIIVSDLDMPRMDGMEFIRHLGELGYPVAVILTSALDRALLSSVASMTQAYGISLLGTLEKPPSAAALKALIDLHAPEARASAPRGPGRALRAEEIEAALRNDEFEPFFQPKVALPSGRLCGAEALARWRHPRLGIVQPHAFIPAIESGPLIDELTWTMLTKTARAHAAWRRDGMRLTMAVNLSAASLDDTRLADRVTRLVRDLGMEPRDLVLEVTESAATSDIGRALENLSRLRMKGFGLAIDDYGTGYSSMQQLTRIPFTELKIDQSFVKCLPAQGSGRVVLESSLDMARRLDLTSVAEGVETSDQWDLLVQLGCDQAQGYFIAMPMEAAAFAAWARTWDATRNLRFASG